MANKLSTIGFNAGQSEKQSGENSINYIPYPTGSNDFNGGAVSLYSTTGIRGPIPSNITIPSDGFDYLYSEVFTFDGTNTGVEGSGWAYWNRRLLQFAATTVSSISISGLTSSVSSRAVRFSSNQNIMVFLGNNFGPSFCQKFNSDDGTVTPVDVSAINDSSGDGQNEPLFLADTEYYGGRFLYATSAGPDRDYYARVYYSQVQNPDIEDTLSFIGFADDVGELRGLHELNGRLYVFSERIIAVFVPQNSTTIPFIEQQGSRINFGLVGPSCKAEVDGVLYFIGMSQGRIHLMALSGGSVSIISNDAIDNKLNSGSWSVNVNYFAYQSRVFGFTNNGRSYVAFSFSEYTLCLDPKTGLFHQRTSPTAPSTGQWDMAGSCRASGVSLGDGDGESMMVGSSIIDGTTGDPMTFNAGRTDNSIGTEFGNLVERTAISSPYNSDGVTNRVSEIQLISDIDNNPIDPNWPEPTINLSVSSDYGYTFTAYPEQSRKFGEQGVRDRLLRWNNIGAYRQSFVIKLRTLNPYPHQIVKVLAKIKKGYRQI